MRQHWAWLAGLLGLLAVVPSQAQLYKPGLNAIYLQFDPEAPEESKIAVERVDTYPWFYFVSQEMNLGEFHLTRPPEFPWPQDVLDGVDLRYLAARWSGYLFVPQAGHYAFELFADDIGVLEIDDNEVVVHVTGFYQRTRRGLRANPPSVAETDLASGFHRISLYYLNAGLTSGIFLRWRLPGAEQFTVIPGHSLVHDPDEDKAFDLPPELRQGSPLVGSGTGFAVDSNGWLLTCHHVVAGGEPSVLIDDQEYPATVVSTDARRDLALLKIEATDLPVIPLAEVAKANRQDEVLCFGFPLADLLGFDLSVENGRITSIRKTGGETRLQTNAPVKHGNSGGPMINLRGEVLGVISERIEIDGAPEGVAFAVPIDLAAALLQKIPEFHPIWGGGEDGLDAGEVDRKVSGAVFPILMRKPVAADGD